LHFERVRTDRRPSDADSHSRAVRFPAGKPTSNSRCPPAAAWAERRLQTQPATIYGDPRDLSLPGLCRAHESCVGNPASPTDRQQVPNPALDPLPNFGQGCPAAGAPRAPTPVGMPARRTAEQLGAVQERLCGVWGIVCKSQRWPQGIVKVVSSSGHAASMIFQ